MILFDGILTIIIAPSHIVSQTQSCKLNLE